MKQVRVVRVIKEGEEILVRYQGGNEVWSRDERQIWLRNWNFICNCEVCSMTGDELMENEKARKKMGDLGAAMDVKSIEKVRDPFLSLDCTWRATFRSAKHRLQVSTGDVTFFED